MYSPFLVIALTLAATTLAAKSATPMCADKTNCTMELQALLNDTDVDMIHLKAGGGDGHGRYIATPLYLFRPNVTIRCDSGTTLLAMRGEFKSTGKDTANLLSVHGDDFTMDNCHLKMWRDDYNNKHLYNHSEFRCALHLMSTRNAVVRNSLMESSGGDGITISQHPYPNWMYALCPTNTLISNVTCRNNYRQGMSVICAEDLVVENSTFEGTKGTMPQSGLDIEPSWHTQKITNLTFRNIVFRNNSNFQICVSLGFLSNASQTLSIAFENITGVDSLFGIEVRVPHDYHTPDSRVSFNNVVIENTRGYGIFGVSANMSRPITFTNTLLRNVSNQIGYAKAAILVPEKDFRNVAFGVEGSPITIETPFYDKAHIKDLPEAVYVYSKNNETSMVGITGALNVTAYQAFACGLQGPSAVAANFTTECHLRHNQSSPAWSPRVGRH